MINENDESVIVSDLIKFLLCELKKRNMPISHFKLQEIIFKIKMELGKDHPLYEKLPFYWYEEGPFSEIVAEEFKKISDKYCHKLSSDDMVSYFRELSNKNNLIDNYPAIKDISDDVFKNQDPFLNRFDEEIYINYAPYSFMHPFKLLFEATINENLNLSPNNYLKTYYGCLSKLPYDNLLNDFSILFMRIYARLELLNDENQFMNYWSLIRDSVQKSWFCFASGVRIRFHDSFYDDEIDAWKCEFDERMADLSRSVNLLEDKTGPIFGKDFDSVPFDKETYEATIGTYLKG